MKRSTLLAALTVAGATLVGSIAEGDRKKGGGDYRPLGDDASWTTVHTNTLGLEGLTADAKGNLYSPARNAAGDCPIVRVPASGGSAVTVGTIPTPCSPAGLAFDKRGDLYVTNAPSIYRLRPSASSPPVATVFATDVPGANGVAFDERGALWVSDGGQGQGRVWRIRGSGGPPEEMLRVQPMANAAGVGRDARSLPPGRLAGHRRQRARLRPRRLAVHRRHRARRDLARRDRAARAGAQRGRLRHHVHVEHAVPEQRVRAAPGARGRRRDRARPRGQHRHGGQRAQRRRGGDAALRRRRAVPQPGEPGRACATRARSSSRRAR